MQVDQGLDQWVALPLILGLDMKDFLAVFDIGVVAHDHGIIINKSQPTVKD
jgi:hypothetical protein